MTSAKDPPVLGPKYQKACDEANKFIQEVVTMVSNCLILVELLEQLTKKEAHFCQLVGASAIIDSSQEEFRKELNLCKSMLAAYEEHKQQLQVAVSCLSEVVCNIEGNYYTETVAFVLRISWYTHFSVYGLGILSQGDNDYQPDHFLGVNYQYLIGEVT